MNELQSRREFFKKAIGKVIPILAIMSSPSSFFMSCSKLDDVSNGDNQSGNNSDGGNDNKGDKSISAATGSIDGQEYVDLGLSVKWARYNFGASSPAAKGSYMAFTAGATGSNSVSVRTNLMKAGYGNGSSIAGSEFDQVSKNWGNKWRMPSKSDWEELVSNSNIERYEYDNAIGLKFTSKKNGRSIFLPGVGYKGGIDEIKNHYGYYWTSLLSKLSASGAYAYYLWWSFGETKFAIHYNTDSITEYQMTIRSITDGGNNPSSCNHNCTASCASNSTSTGCSSCGSNCFGGCKASCDYNCAATCTSHCYGSCNDTCGGACKYISAGSSCSGCASTCSGRCYRACSYACSSNCESSCINGSK